jgi:hypothetical protein
MLDAWRPPLRPGGHREPKTARSARRAAALDPHRERAVRDLREDAEIDDVLTKLMEPDSRGPDDTDTRAVTVEAGSTDVPENCWPIVILTDL